MIMKDNTKLQMSRRAQPETGCSADDTQTAGKTKSNQGVAVRPTATRSGPSRTDFERGIKTNRCRSRHICEAPTGPSADPAGRSKTPISGALQDRLYGQCRALRQARAAQALMRASGDSADLASVIDAAVTEKLEKLEAKRYGTTKSPRKSLEETDTSPSSRNIPAPAPTTTDNPSSRHSGIQGRP